MNFVIKNEHWEVNQDLELALFGDWNGTIEPPIMYVESTADIFDILVAAKLFPSKGQARKNWKETGKDVPPGFNLWTVGKLKQLLAVWVPIPDSLTVCTDT